MDRRRGKFLIGLVALAAIGVDAAADARRFTYVYETTTQAKGAREYEQWVTWKTSKEDNRSFDRFDFRHEIEYGVTDRFQLGLYVDWRHEEDRMRGDTDLTRWRDVAIEAKFSLTDPVTDPIGLGLYGEVYVGHEFFELEAKLLAQKNIGPFVLAYNFTVEAEWEGDNLDEDNGEINQTAGISYQFSPSFMAGLEMLHEIEVPDWSGAKGSNAFYIGPNVSYRSKDWWVTLTPLFQVSSLASEPDYEVRVIFGFDF